MVGIALIFVPAVRAVADIKIGVVDSQRVINDSIVGKAARSNVEAELKKGQGRLAQLKTDFEKAQSDLQKQASVLSGSAVEEKKDALEKKRREFDRAAQDLREEVMRKNDSEISKVVNEISTIVKALAKDSGYTFIFERDKDSVVYASDAIDLTATIVKELDKKKVAL